MSCSSLDFSVFISTCWSLSRLVSFQFSSRTFHSTSVSFSLLPEDMFDLELMKVALVFCQDCSLKGMALPLEELWFRLMEYLSLPCMGLLRKVSGLTGALGGWP